MAKLSRMFSLFFSIFFLSHTSHARFPSILVENSATLPLNEHETLLLFASDKIETDNIVPPAQKPPPSAVNDRRAPIMWATVNKPKTDDIILPAQKPPPSAVNDRRVPMMSVTVNKPNTDNTILPAQKPPLGAVNDRRVPMMSVTVNKPNTDNTILPAQKPPPSAVNDRRVPMMWATVNKPNTDNIILPAQKPPPSTANGRRASMMWATVGFPAIKHLNHIYRGRPSLISSVHPCRHSHYRPRFMISYGSSTMDAYRIPDRANRLSDKKSRLPVKPVDVNNGRFCNEQYRPSRQVIMRGRRRERQEVKRQEQKTRGFTKLLHGIINPF